MKNIMIILLLAMPASAVVISQVLYDPIGSESTGESIRIYNNDTAAIDISGWWIGTERSAKDATIPSGTTLHPGQYFTIGDPNVSAELNDQITLNNEDSGVQLVNNGTIIDAVGWGNPNESFYRGTPAQQVKEGSSLIRVSYSDNNAEDFAPSNTDTGMTANIIITISKTITMTDDEAAPGYQINPIPGQIRIIEVFTDAPAVFLNKTYLPDNGIARIPVNYSLPPKNYSIITSTTINFEYLPLKAAKLLDNELRMTGQAGTSLQGFLRFANIGNIPIVLLLNSSFKDISFSITDGNVEAGSAANIKITATIPNKIQSGTYQGTLSFSY